MGAVLPWLARQGVALVETSPVLQRGALHGGYPGAQVMARSRGLS